MDEGCTKRDVGVDAIFNAAGKCSAICLNGNICGQVCEFNPQVLFWKLR